MLDSFLPLAKGVPSNLAEAALLVAAITATLSRWQAGRHGDRYGHARLLIPALFVAALGMAAMIWLASPVLIFARASALWNLAYDAGYGAGPAAFGLFAARTGYPAAFAMTGILVLAVLPAARRERKVVASAAADMTAVRMG